MLKKNVLLRPLLFVLAIVPLSTISLAEDVDTTEDSWKLRRDKDGIQIYTRNVVDSKFDEVRGTMTIHAQLQSVVALIRDGDACPDWADLCKESRVLQTTSETEYYAYNLNNVPWPVADRDAITHVTWSQDPTSKTVEMVAQAIESDLVPKRKKTLRMTKSVTGWQLTQLEDGMLDVVSTGHIDPSGPTPAWVTNMLLVDSPFKTLAGLRQQMEEDNYSESRFEFISAP